MDVVQALRTRCDVRLSAADQRWVTEDFKQYRDDLCDESGEPLLYPSTEEANACDCAEKFAIGRYLCARTAAGCDCTAATGNFYSVTTGELLLHALPPSLPLVECGPACACDTRSCSLRVTQQPFRLRMVLSPHKSFEKGLALYTAEAAGQGAFLCLYAGELLNSAAAKQRWEARKAGVHGLEGRGNYILSLRENGKVIGHVDATHKANLGRFLNHSCDPTCIIHLVRWGSQAIPRPAIFLKRDLVAGEELTFDYGNASGGADPLPVSAREKADNAGALSPCLCESTLCRGYMPFDETL